MFARELPAHFVGRVHRVVAADVAEVADVVRAKHVDDAIEVFRLMFAELVAASADRAGGGSRPQQSNLFRILPAEVEQLFLEHTFDAVPTRVDRADLGQIASGLHETAEGIVDDGRGSTRLGDDQVFRHVGRVSPFPRSQGDAMILDRPKPFQTDAGRR